MLHWAYARSYIFASDGEQMYCDEEPSAGLVSFFRQRRDNQIMSLEVLSVAYGIPTFSEYLQGRDVVIFFENAGAEAAVAKDPARSFDHGRNSAWNLVAPGDDALWRVD